MSRANAFVLIACFFAAFPAAAQAGTLSSDGNTVRYVGAPGEVNQLSVNQFDSDIGYGPGTASFRDVSGIDAVGPNCYQQNVGSGVYWHCKDLSPTARIVVELGDRSDNNQFNDNPFSQIEVDGGSGDDVISGANTSDILRGGEGDDRMSGDEYYISFTESNYYTVHGADDFSGGPGSDLVSYYNHRPVSRVTGTVDDVPNDGDPDERDNVRTDVEGLEAPLFGSGAFTGSGAADSLFGSGGADVLIGLGGNDSIRASEGNDVLDAGVGDDFLEGGADDDQLDGGVGLDSYAGDFSGSTNQVIQGNDRIKSADGVAEDVSCGPGADTVDADAIDRVVTDGQNLCETVNKTGAGPGGPGGGPGGTPPPTNALAFKATKRQKLKSVLGKGFAATFICPGACKASATATLSKKLARRYRVATTIARGSGTLLAAGEGKLAVKLNAKAKKRLKRVRSLAVKLNVTLTDAAGAKTRKSATVTLRR